MEFILQSYPIHLLILVLLISIGSIDEVFYHILSAKLYSREESIYEQIFHTLRSFLYFLIIPCCLKWTFYGAYIYIPLSLLALDIFVAVADIISEKKSRENLNGLSLGEYFLHMNLAFVLGTFYYTYISSLIANYSMPSAIKENIYESSIISSLLMTSAFVSLILAIIYSTKIIRIYRKANHPNLSTQE